MLTPDNTQVTAIQKRSRVKGVTQTAGQLPFPAPTPHPKPPHESPIMTDKTSFLTDVAQAFHDIGLTAAITALIGGFIALLAAIARRAFTNDAMLARLDRELLAERDRVDRQRAEDRKGDADRLERIETDIRAMRDLMFKAFQRGGGD